MGWIDVESFRFFCPTFHDEFERCEPFERLQPFAVVVGIHEGGEVFTQPLMAFVVIAPHGRFLQSAVHALGLTIRPGMVRLGEPVIDIMLGTGQLE